MPRSKRPLGRIPMSKREAQNLGRLLQESQDVRRKGSINYARMLPSRKPIPTPVIHRPVAPMQAAPIPPAQPAPTVKKKTPTAPPARKIIIPKVPPRVGVRIPVDQELPLIPRGTREEVRRTMNERVSQTDAFEEWMENPYLNDQHRQALRMRFEGNETTSSIASKMGIRENQAIHLITQGLFFMREWQKTLSVQRPKKQTQKITLQEKLQTHRGKVIRKAQIRQLTGLPQHSFEAAGIIQELLKKGIIRRILTKGTYRKGYYRVVK